MHSVVARNGWTWAPAVAAAAGPFIVAGAVGSVLDDGTVTGGVGWR